MSPGIEIYASPPGLLPVRSDLCTARAALALLTALLLIATLIGPSTFIIAKRATTAPHAQTADTRLVEEADRKGGGEESSHDPKRPKGALHSSKISSALAFVASQFEDVRLRANEADASSAAIFTTEAEPESTARPPQLLQRPPPISGG